MIEIKIEKRPEILPMPVPIYEHTDSEIPDRVRISFTNGTSAIYNLDMPQPAPQVKKCIRIIRHMKETTVGYQYKPRRRGRK